jgi:hypothetical protein
VSLLRGAAVAAMAALSLVACSSSDGESTSTPEASAVPTSVDESQACAFLSAADRKRLAGVALDQVVAADARSGGSQCRWSSGKGLIEITSVPSTAWAKTLPDVVSELASDVKTAKDKRELARATTLLKGADSFDAAEACDAFGTLASLEGEARGGVAVKFISISTSELGVSAQVCSRGVLTSIVYSEPGLVESAKYEKRVARALRAAQKRASA